MSSPCPSNSVSGFNVKSKCAFGTIATCFLSCALMLSATAADARSAAERAAFQRSNPCPSTGKTTGKCPGYVVDHLAPLCAGGADSPANMQWQELEASKAKDKQEWRHCRELRRAANGNGQL